MLLWWYLCIEVCACSIEVCVVSFLARLAFTVLIF